MDDVVLKTGREKSVLRRHPWIFSGAIQHVSGNPGLGDTVLIRDSTGQELALGAYSPASNIRIRLWTWEPRSTIGKAFFKARLEQSLSARKSLIVRSNLDGFASDAYRLVYAESDGLPGLIVDQYGSTLVMQCLSAGAERWRETIAELLIELTPAACIFERSDADVRQLEGLPPKIGVLHGEEPSPRIRIIENNKAFWVDIRQGHKTGFYLDQRENRLRLGTWAQDREVLDCFCYTGGITLYALGAGAKSVTAVDSSIDSLALAGENLNLQNQSSERISWVKGDVFQELRKFRDSGRSFDMIVLDPPKFAPTASQAASASRGYKDINLLALKLLRPGGLLATFSCSGGVSDELFQKILFSAALDAGVDAQIIERYHQAGDHPVALNFPEGSYLKGLLIQI